MKRGAGQLPSVFVRGKLLYGFLRLWSFPWDSRLFTRCLPVLFANFPGRLFGDVEMKVNRGGMGIKGLCSASVLRTGISEQFCPEVRWLALRGRGECS